MLVVLLSACRRGTPSPTAAVAQDTAVPPTAAPPTEDLSILYQDDFSDADSGWPVVQADNGLASYQSPHLYRLEVRAAETVLQSARPGAFSDFSLEAKVSATGGGGQWQHGLTFRQITPDNYYAFFVNAGAQSWQVKKRLLGAWSLLAEGSNPAIPADPQTSATLRVDASGPNLTFSINGQGLVSLTDGSFAAGDIGFALETLSVPSAQLDVDIVVVRRYDAASVPAAPTAVPIVPTETPTPTETQTPTPTVARGTAAPTADLRTTIPGGATAVAGTAAAVIQTASAFASQSAVVQTAAALASQVPAVLTQACGLPGLPACP
jgi:hypothetical protein